MSVIGLQNVSKRFRNRLSTQEPTVSLQLEEFHVAEGEQIALTGPSGCGKSTLLNLIAGVLKPDAGSVVQVAGQHSRNRKCERDGKPDVPDVQNGWMNGEARIL